MICPRVARWLLALIFAGTAATARAQGPAAPVPEASPAPEPAPAFVTPPEPAPPPVVVAPAPVVVTTPVAPPKEDAPPDGVWVRRRVPRSIGVWAGWAWNPVNYLPMRSDGVAVKPHGASLVVDYGWQVGGLKPGGWPTYVGFILGSTFYPGNAERHHGFTLEYGILVRHHLAPTWKVHPFLAYGLGAIQVFVFGVEGRGIGHLTRLSVGLEAKVSNKVRLGLEIVYKLDPIRGFKLDSNMPAPKFDIHTLSALFGVNFSL